MKWSSYINQKDRSAFPVSTHAEKKLGILSGMEHEFKPPRKAMYRAVVYLAPKSTALGREAGKQNFTEIHCDKLIVKNPQEKVKA